MQHQLIEMIFLVLSSYQMDKGFSLVRTQCFDVVQIFMYTLTCDQLCLSTFS